MSRSSACRDGRCSGSSTSGWRSVARPRICRSWRAAPTRSCGESTDDLVARAAREVAEAIPGARSATLVRGTVIREKHATFSLAAGQPARPPTETGLAGLWLAGDWIDTGLPGTIESAVVSGHGRLRQC